MTFVLWPSFFQSWGVRGVRARSNHRSRPGQNTFTLWALLKSIVVSSGPGGHQPSRAPSNARHEARGLAIATRIGISRSATFFRVGTAFLGINSSCVDLTVPPFPPSRSLG